MLQKLLHHQLQLGMDLLSVTHSDFDQFSDSAHEISAQDQPGEGGMKLQFPVRSSLLTGWPCLQQLELCRAGTTGSGWL